MFLRPEKSTLAGNCMQLSCPEATTKMLLSCPRIDGDTSPHAEDPEVFEYSSTRQLLVEAFAVL